MATNIGERIKQIDSNFLRKDIPDFNVGDTVKMKVKVQEADKVRLHPFEGVVIAKCGSGLKLNFTVRKVSSGEGVERVFPLYSPVIDRIEIIRSGKVRRAKLYYLRSKIGKRATKIEGHDETQAKPV